MIEGIEFGWAKGVQDEQCAKKVDVAARMLCGREVGFVPVAGQPEFTPKNLHEQCRLLLFGPTGHADRKAAEVRRAVCPACEGLAPVFEGRIQAHGVFRQRGDLMVEGDDACLGVNMRPKRGGR